MGVIFILASNHFSILLRCCQYAVIIKKLKKWVKEYWQEDGSMFLYESQYKRLQMILADIID